jgi:hypothetical protein
MICTPEPDMNHRNDDRHLAMIKRRMAAYGGAIEWEELPSLAETLQQRLVHGDGRRYGPPSGWDVTMPAALDPLTESGPFTETMNGLVTRELLEPDVFRHFFA